MAETDSDIPEATSAMQQLSPDAQHNSPPSSPDSAAAEFEEEEDPGIDIADLERVYKCLQGPLLWGLPEFSESKMSRHIYRIRDLLLVPHSTWGAVVLRFTLCWLYFKHGDMDQSRAQLSEIDVLVQTVEWSGEDGALLRRCLDGVEHVLQATWVHLAHRNTPLRDMWYELAQITPFKDLSPQQQAVVWGLQASCRYCFFEWVGFRLKAAAIRAQELYPREPEWQRVYGDQPVSVVGDAFTPHIAIYGATWHLQKKRPEPARELLRRALTAWPENAFVQLNAAVMYAREKSSIRDEEMAEKCSAAAVRIAPDCVIANVVRRMVIPSHHAPCLALCETTYGKNVLALLPFMSTGTFSLEVIMRGFFMR